MLDKKGEKVNFIFLMMLQQTKRVLQSMTGYGESSYESEDLYLHVAIKTVNSKYLDVDAHLPRTFAQQESSWRKLFADTLKRGKVFFSLTCQLRCPQASEVLNEDLLKEYSSFLQKMSQQLNTSTDLLVAALRLPGVVRPEAVCKVSDETVTIATQTVKEALNRCLASRQQEGAALHKKLQTYLQCLRKKLTEMDIHVEKRQKVLRTKLQERLGHNELTPQEWEQELTLSLNKASIEEEKVRLKTHLDFFEKTLAESDVIGKKLTFIIQELGRELSTIGAKAQYGPLQHLAVDMKEVVEQMREQIANLV